MAIMMATLLPRCLLTFMLVYSIVEKDETKSVNAFSSSRHHRTLLVKRREQQQQQQQGYYIDGGNTAAATTTTTTTTSSSTALSMSTWSDSKAVRDYQDFLASGRQEIEVTADGPSAIVVQPDDPASVQLTEALIAMGAGDDAVITPDQDLPGAPDAEFPVYITIPPHRLNDFLQNLPASYKAKNENFVFFSGGLQYGNIEDILKERGYCRDAMTQVLISGMRVTPAKRVQDVSVSLGIDSNGEEKRAGECAACGKWSGSIAERLQRNGVTCRTDFYREWRRRMWERSTYDAVFHLLGAVRSEPTTVDQVAAYYDKEASDMLWEMSQLLRGWKALTFTYGFEERMFAVAESAAGSGEPCVLAPEAVYPYIWGNPMFSQSRSYCEYLYYAQQEKGLLRGIQLPVKSIDDFKTKMRQGNLRADGVV